MTLIELQNILGRRIEIATNNDLTLEERQKETEISQTISSLAKQMINNADIVLRAEKLVYEGKLRGSNIEKIVELRIPADAKRLSATGRKCRANKAVVISITTLEGDPAGNEVRSDHDKSFAYRVGETVEVQNFDENRWNECAPGIHHYITREEAVRH